MQDLVGEEGDNYFKLICFHSLRLFFLVFDADSYVLTRQRLLCGQGHLCVIRMRDSVAIKSSLCLLGSS